MSCGYQYTLFGLSICSNRKIPVLPPNNSSHPVEVTIWFAADEMPNWAEAAKSELWHVSEWKDDGVPSLKVWRINSHWFLMLYSDGTEFMVSDREIWTRWGAPLTFADNLTYLLGPVLGFVLRLRGTISLHASALVYDGSAVALLGGPGAGKSTLAAALGRLGYPILSDDIVALREEEEGFLAQPGYPCLRLWPSSTRMLFGSTDALPRITPNWDKRYLEVTEPHYHFEQLARQLRAIYFLDPIRDDSSKPIIEEISGTEALLCLVGNTYSNYLLTPEMRACEFEFLTRLLRDTYFRKLRLPHDSDCLFQSCEAIMADFKCSRAAVRRDVAVSVS